MTCDNANVIYKKIINKDFQPELDNVSEGATRPHCRRLKMFPTRSRFPLSSCQPSLDWRWATPCKENSNFHKNRKQKYLICNSLGETLVDEGKPFFPSPLCLGFLEQDVKLVKFGPKLRQQRLVVASRAEPRREEMMKILFVADIKKVQTYQSPSGMTINAGLRQDKCQPSSQPSHNKIHSGWSALPKVFQLNFKVP